MSRHRRGNRAVVVLARGAVMAMVVLAVLLSSLPMGTILSPRGTAPLSGQSAAVAAAPGKRHAGHGQRGPGHRHDKKHKHGSQGKGKQRPDADKANRGADGSGPRGGRVKQVPVPKRNDDSDPAIRDRYIVVLKDDGGKLRAAHTGVDVKAAAVSLASAHRMQLGDTYKYAIAGFAATIPPEELAAVAHDSRVAGIVPVERMELANHTPISPLVPTGIDRIGADLNHVARIDGILSPLPNFQNTDTPVDVAVLDTGVDPHYDLNLVGGMDATAPRGSAECVVTTGDFHDIETHGTMVAGIIGARDNGSETSSNGRTNVVGVAPGVRLWSVRMYIPDGADRDREPDGTTEWTMCGLDWVLAHADEIDVVNISSGAKGSDTANCGRTSTAVVDPYHLAICRVVNAGVTVVVSAGNECDNAANYRPAAYDEVITVSALADFDGRPGGFASSKADKCVDRFQDNKVKKTGTDQDDALAIFSNFGSDIDLAAPGVDILTTCEAASFCTGGGTSFSAPHVAGAAAVMLAGSSLSGRSPANVKQKLLSAREVVHLPADTDGRDEGIVKLGPSSLLTLSASGGTVSQQIKATIQGLQSGETISSLKWFNGSTSITLVMTPSAPRADAKGNTTATFKIPASGAGAHKLVVAGNNHSTATATFTVRPSLSPSARNLRPGQSFTVTLRGFKANSGFLLALEDTAGKRTNLKNVSTDATGSAVQAPLKIPTTTKPGSYKLVALEYHVNNPHNPVVVLVKIAETTITVTSAAAAASDGDDPTALDEPSADPRADVPAPGTRGNDSSQDVKSKKEHGSEKGKGKKGHGSKEGKTKNGHGKDHHGHGNGKGKGGRHQQRTRH